MRGGRRGRTGRRVDHPEVLRNTGTGFAPHTSRAY